MFSMPGPSSRAITWIPVRPRSSRTTLSSTSPRTAYVVMLRATSEIAVASSVWSVLVSSSFPAISRARWRAVTTSASDSIGMTDCGSSATVAGLPGPLQQREPFLEVERGGHVLEAHPELHHREGHLGLDPDDDRLGSAQPRHPRDPLERP